MAKVAKSQIARDWRVIWGMPEGRRALSDLFAQCRVFEPMFADDPHGTSWNDGRRSAALIVMQYLTAKPADFDKYVQAMKEIAQDDDD